MIGSSGLIQDYLRRLRRSAGAESICLYAAPLWSGARPLFVQNGEPPFVAELETLETAEAFDRDIAPQLESVQLGAAAVHLPSARPDCRLVRVSADSAFVLADSVPKQSLPGRRRSDKIRAVRPSYCVLIGFRFPSGSRAFPAGQTATPMRLALDVTHELAAERSWLLAFIAMIAWQTQEVANILHDPISRLPGRIELLALLDRSLSESRRSSNPTSLLLINPDEFDSINEMFGREAGDEVIRDIARRIRVSFRGTDYVAKYGGASFACVLPGMAQEKARIAAETTSKQWAEASFLSGSVRLGFSVGISVFIPGEDDRDTPLDLIRRADQALYAAKRGGGGRSVAWQQELEAEEAGQLDRLTGIFTGNLSKDYRNMVLLLDTVSTLAGSDDLQRLAVEVAERLHVAFNPEFVGLFASTHQGLGILLRRSQRREPVGEQCKRDPKSLGPARNELIERAQRERRPVIEQLPCEASDERDATQLVCVVPLLQAESCLGCLYLEGNSESFSIDSSDLLLLKALAPPLAVAIDRSQLAEQEQLRLEEERHQLETELDELRGALQAAKLVYRSPEIESVLGVARRVASTDATVLITGESGTGKELLARAIHELSPRRPKPFVVVDCASVPTSLMESELFGHERGAFTGAERRKLGRLAEADGATVLLDEIGELPIEVQSKLLRFVQDKSFTPVGGSTERVVDVRLIAATNRDLVAEVEAGAFREDLYHRLNVIRLVVPPLRDRPHDILYLADHFREVYSLLYRKTGLRFTSEAEAVLLQYSWPGNVRELQNHIMQAVILCEGRQLGVTELSLTQTPPSPAVAARPTTPKGGEGAVSPGGARPAQQGDLWENLRCGLRALLEAMAEADVSRPLPLGKWLAEDLVLEASAAANGVSRRAAAILGIPETTVRRKLGQAQDHEVSGASLRSASWPQVRAILAQIVASSRPDGSDLPARAESLLLEELDASLPEDIRFRSAVLGVTEITYRRRVAQSANM